MGRAQSVTPRAQAWASVAMSGAKHRIKGNRVEREIVDRHKEIGVHAERYPLSGASRFRGSGHDTDVYAFGKEEAPLVAEVKARKDGKGFTTLETWLGDYDVLFLRRNNADPMVVVPWRVWQRILELLPGADKIE
jgi:Holliday junction resolvase